MIDSAPVGTEFYYGSLNEVFKNLANEITEPSKYELFGTIGLPNW